MSILCPPETCDRIVEAVTEDNTLRVKHGDWILLIKRDADGRAPDDVQDRIAIWIDVMHRDVGNL